MIGVESVLTKIVFALLKKATAQTAFAVVGKAIEVYSIFDTIRDAAHVLQTTSDCRKLQTYGLRVLADQVSDRVIDKLLNVGGTTYEVRQTSGGILVASNLAPTFQIAPPPPERPGDVLVRQFLAAYDAGVRGRELRKALELAFLAAPERWKLHVQTFSNGDVVLSETETYTLDGCREFRFRRVKKGFRVWYGENGFGWVNPIEANIVNPIIGNIVGNIVNRIIANSLCNDEEDGCED